MLPMWLSMGFTTRCGVGPTSGASCANAGAAAKTKPTMAVKRVTPTKCADFSLSIICTLNQKLAPANRVRRRLSWWLEVEIKSHQQFAGVDIRAGQRRCAGLMENVELVVPGKTSPAGHEWVVTVADGVGSDIAEVGPNGIQNGALRSLLRHPDSFVSRQED